MPRRPKPIQPTLIEGPDPYFAATFDLVQKACAEYAAAAAITDPATHAERQASIVATAAIAIVEWFDAQQLPF